MWRSVPQIVEASIFTMASVGAWIVGSGTSSQARCPGPWYTRAFILRLLFLRVSGRVAPTASAPLRRGAAAFPYDVGLARGRVVGHRRAAARALHRGSRSHLGAVARRAPAPDRRGG